jgi:hypothetical protein
MTDQSEIRGIAQKVRFSDCWGAKREPYWQSLCRAELGEAADVGGDRGTFWRQKYEHGRPGRDEHSARDQDLPQTKPMKTARPQWRQPAMQPASSSE